jgi:hypothetical protein
VEHETGACREENARSSQKSNTLRVGMVKRMPELENRGQALLTEDVFMDG